MTIIEQISKLYAENGDSAYFGEPVSQLEHALQCAHLATEAGAPPPLIIAALLHDIGHLLHGLPESIADQGVDGKHERAGAEWLASHFNAAVIEPVRLHVDAKRYLCAVDLDYEAGLSPASRQSLALQGGRMSLDEVNRFRENPFYRQALVLREWDDRAKIPGLAVPRFESYLEAMLAQMISERS